MLLDHNTPSLPKPVWKYLIRLCHLQSRINLRTEGLQALAASEKYWTAGNKTEGAHAHLFACRK